MVIRIKILFWNLKKKDLSQVVFNLVEENCIDILALVDMDSIYNDRLLHCLNKNDNLWVQSAIKPEGNIAAYAKKDISIIPFEENKHYSVYKIKTSSNLLLLTVLHFPSAMYQDEGRRSAFAQNINQQLVRLEEEAFDNNEYKSIVIGDFNLQPFSFGVSDALAFNATMSKEKAKKINRKMDGIDCYYYYNPTRKLYAGKNEAQGSYYCDNDQQGKSMFWYMFDEVLIRPALINAFNDDYFSIVTTQNGEKMANSNGIYGNIFSDHLPIKFEIMEDKL